MTSFVVGLPRCNEPTEIFEATLRAIEASTAHPIGVLIIDNGDEPLGETVVTTINSMWRVLRPDRNVGCAGAWNLVCEFARGADEPLVILNGDCAVAPDTFAKIFETPAPALVCAHGFSCFRIDREVIEKVGPFDEEYYPVYWEDTDYRYRCKLAGVEIVEWKTDEIDRPSFGRAKYGTGVTHGWRLEDRGYQGWTGEKLAWFYARYEANMQRYVKKWGGMPGEETFKTPFDGKE